jgi:superfamily II DNA or RNA helicase
VHRYAGSENVRALLGPHAYTLGLSATVEGGFDTSAAEKLITALGPIFYRYTLQQALADGVLARLALSNIRVSMLEEEQRRYDALSTRIRILAARFGISDERTQHTLRARARVAALAAIRIPVTVRLALDSAGKKLIVFHESVDHAIDIANLLTARGLNTSVYHSRMSPIARRESLRLFLRGVNEVMVACRALDEGLNAPSVEMAIIASGTATARQRIQRIGRVLRVTPKKESALVTTLFASEPEKQRLDREVESMQGLVASVQWRQVQSNDG